MYRIYLFIEFITRVLSLSFSFLLGEGILSSDWGLFLALYLGEFGMSGIKLGLLHKKYIEIDGRREDLILHTARSSH